jgi:hypothetical protein
MIQVHKPSIAGISLQLSTVRQNSRPTDESQRQQQTAPALPADGTGLNSGQGWSAISANTGGGEALQGSAPTGSSGCHPLPGLAQSEVDTLICCV